MKKIRLDTFLVQNGISDSIENAKKEIIAGWVKVNSETIRQPSAKIDPLASVIIASPKGKFVSRGGEKLEYALKQFAVDVNQKIVADLGSSTGGFTHCLLLNGAKKVYSVDVGYGQLAYSLRNDKRVVVMERTNVRALSSEKFNERIDFVTADLSFVSITEIYQYIVNLFAPIKGVFLLKPQFESMDGEHKKGVVLGKENHLTILKRVILDLVKQGMGFLDITVSPIKGAAGNIEFLVYFSSEKTEIENEDVLFKIESVVEIAYATP